MAAHAAKAVDAMRRSDYPAAITHYEAALKEFPNSVDYHIKLSTCNQRLKDYTAALTVAEAAVRLARKRAVKELIAQAQMRRGITLYSMGNVREAKAVFRIITRMGGGWQQGTGAGDYGRQGLKGVQGLEIWIDKVEKAVMALPEKERGDLEVAEFPEEVKKTVVERSSTAEAPKQTAQGKDEVRVKHEWYQSKTDIVITIFAKGVDKSKVSADIQDSSLSISFPLPTRTDTTYDFTIDPLTFPIIPDESTCKTMSTKIELNLRKATPSQRWQALESSNSAPAGNSPADMNDGEPTSKKQVSVSEPARAPTYPTSSKTGPKDWEALGNDAQDQDSENVDTFFKQLYKDADPDTRRAMIKSYQESNGTSLSTNWSEVGQKKVETQPPEGMEAKSY